MHMASEGEGRLDGGMSRQEGPPRHPTIPMVLHSQTMHHHPKAFARLKIYMILSSHKVQIKTLIGPLREHLKWVTLLKYCCKN